jgi:putative acetyltransferase
VAVAAGAAATTTDLRPETPADFDAIRDLLDRAFASSQDESRLVDQLRADDAHVPELCLVATAYDGGILGHVFFSRATLDSGHEILVLAPMAVLPERQRAGIGSQLARGSRARAAETDFPLVSVVGHAAYYPRFGFEPARPLGIDPPFEVPDEAWMALRLPRYTEEARGTLHYPAAFDSL